MGLFDKKEEKSTNAQKSFFDMINENRKKAEAQKKAEKQKEAFNSFFKPQEAKKEVKVAEKKLEEKKVETQVEKTITDSERVSKLLEFTKISKDDVDEAIRTNKSISSVIGKSILMIKR